MSNAKYAPEIEMPIEDVKDLVLIAAEDQPSVLFTPQNIEDLLHMVRAKIVDFQPDATTKEGIAAIKSFAFKLRKTKTKVDDIGKEYVSYLKDEPKKIDAMRKKFRDTIDLWHDEVRKPVTELEEKEKERKEAHEAALNFINMMSQNLHTLTAHQISERLVNLQHYMKRDFEEYQDQAESLNREVTGHLQGLYDAVKKREDEQAELDRLRKLETERLQKEREEKIAQQAREDERAKIEKEAEAKKVIPVEEPKTIGQVLDNLPPVTPTSAAEPQKEDFNPQAIRDEHKAMVNREALDSLMVVLNKALHLNNVEKMGKVILTAISKGEVKNVTIQY